MKTNIIIDYLSGEMSTTYGWEHFMFIGSFLIMFILLLCTGDKK